MPKWLLCDEILGDIPALQMTGENQLQFQFCLDFAARDGIRFALIIFHIMADNLTQRFVCRIYVDKLDIQHWIYPVLLW